MSNAIFAEQSPVGAIAITPSDSTIQEYSAVYVGGAGNLKITGRDGQAVTFTAVPVGTTIRVQTRLVWDTGTTATNLVGIG